MDCVMKPAMLFLITTFVLCAAWGQAEVILLNQNAGAERPAPETSGRYLVKPRASKPKPTAAPVTPAPPPPANKVYGPEEQTIEASDTQKNIEQATTLPMVAPDPAEAVEKDDTGNFLERARDSIMGGSPEILDEYRAYLQPDDVRRNLIEIRLAPVLIYNDSVSPSFGRSYNNAMPGLYFSNDIWFTMFFGLNTAYRASLGGAISNNSNNTSFVAASHEWASIGLRFRRFYGFGKMVPALEFGLDLREYQFRVPSDDPVRLKTKTTSAVVSLEAKIPASSRYTSSYQLALMPWTQHSEANSGGAVTSGTPGTNFGVSGSIGGEYKLERTSRIFWKFEYELQRSIFGGSTSGADPISGATLTNVPVSNGFLMFHFGYIWAK